MALPFICKLLAARADTDGQNPPNSFVRLILTDRDGTFADIAFIVVDEAKREILAVALAAISTQSYVNALVDPPSSPPSGTERCYGLGIIAA